MAAYVHKYFYEHYDFKTNKQTFVEDGKIVREQTHKQCPYIVFGEVKPSYVIIKKLRLGCVNPW